MPGYGGAAYFDNEPEFGMIKNGKFSNRNTETIEKLKETIQAQLIIIEEKDEVIFKLQDKLKQKQNEKVYI